MGQRPMRIKLFFSVDLFINFSFFFFFYCDGSSLWMWAFSSCSKQGLLSSHSAQASHCSGFSCCETQALGTGALVVVVHGLSSCDAQA